MKTCFVCREEYPSGESHHVLPRSRGGTEGPEVDLCANCHLSVHNAAKAMTRGKSPDKALAHLSEDARDRALGLVQVILMADLQGIKNPTPLLAVVLDDPVYLEALKRMKADGGFTSQAATVNAIFRRIAQQYGLIDSVPTNSGAKRVPIGILNSSIKSASSND